MEFKFSGYVCDTWCAKCVDDYEGTFIIDDVYEVLDVDGPYIDVYGELADGTMGTICGIHEKHFNLVPPQ